MSKMYYLLIMVFATFATALGAGVDDEHLFIATNKIKIIEGVAEEGHIYRLHISEEKNEKPARLLVWMHGTGGSGNKYVEPMAKDFVNLGYALLVFEKEKYNRWSQKKLKATVAALRDVENLDINKPILMCYSLGGQAALRMWRSKPEWIGGMILNSAYPISRESVKQNIIKLEPIPTHSAIKDIPIMAIVGTEDGGMAVWELAETAYPNAGIDLNVQYVSGAPHIFLIGEMKKEVLRWLKRISEGKSGCWNEKR